MQEGGGNQQANAEVGPTYSLSQISKLAYSYFGLVGSVTVRIAGAIRMLRQLLVSIAVSVCNIAIHAIVMAAVLWVARIASERVTSHRSFQLVAVMTATVSVLMVAHIAEVVVWTFAYAIVDVAPAGTDLIYFAFVNYTTLGYGDVTPVPRWRLLGPMTAMNGVLLFGWSTAVIFAVLRAVMTSQTEEGLREKGARLFD
jgi:hypothetical protein